jgi:Asp-tRNA(Asn)/Glu-tRNA(Gln) amidotransferase A subunit family amidase
MNRIVNIVNDSRRQFLASIGLLAAGSAAGLPESCAAADAIGTADTKRDESEQDGTKFETGSEITPTTIAEAEKIIGISFTESERVQLAQSARGQRARYAQRRSAGFLPNGLSPAAMFDPLLPGMSLPAGPSAIRLTERADEALPKNDEDIAFAPLTSLSRWLRNRTLTSERLTGIYLDRLKRFDARLHCVVTLTEALAMKQAKRADREIAAGVYRGPLHGIPWGAKDLFETKNIRTTWGAMPYKDRIGAEDAYVVRKLEEGGAVLAAKLTLGALAMGDVWFEDVTRNPFNPKQGSSGSSAGPASATAAGLVGFALGTETLGSIVSPCMRCGTTGLRPTFGRVARTGAMALCWSMDKIGPICRTVEDAALVLAAINGSDEGDPSSVDAPFRYDATAALGKLRVGYSPTWFERGASELDRKALAALKALGVKLVEVTLPDEPVHALRTILRVEAAAAFEELTLSDRDDLLVRQNSGAWPSSFRAGWLVPAIELMQADRLRRRVMEKIAAVFADVDMLMSPSFAANLLTTTNFTGHPSLTLRSGFRENGTPDGVTLWGRLFEEGSLCRVGSALEKSLNVWSRRPNLVA